MRGRLASRVRATSQGDVLVLLGPGRGTRARWFIFNKKGASKINDYQEDGKLMPEEAKELMNDPSLLAGPRATGDIDGLVRQTRADAEIKLRSG